MEGVDPDFEQLVMYETYRRRTQEANHLVLYKLWLQDKFLEQTNKGGPLDLPSVPSDLRKLLFQTLADSMSAKDRKWKLGKDDYEYVTFDNEKPITNWMRLMVTFIAGIYYTFISVREHGQCILLSAIGLFPLMVLVFGLYVHGLIVHDVLKTASGHR
jgi:hypothetical protein